MAWNLPFLQAVQIVKRSTAAPAKRRHGIALACFLPA